MNEMDALARMRDEVAVTVTVEEAALLAGIRAQHGPATWAAGGMWRGRLGRGAWQAGLAGAAVLAITAGIIVAQAALPGGPAGPLTVHELADRTAVAAAAQRSVAPGQWVYWREKPATGGWFEAWTTASCTQAAYWSQGKLQIISPPPALHHSGHAGRLQFNGPPEISGDSYSFGSTVVPVNYADLAALPTTPRALVRHLGRLPNWGSAPWREFQMIETLLVSYLMPPRLTAELYRAVADIPGVTVDRHAIDVAGRHGIGLRQEMPAGAGGGAEEIIVNPRTYQLMGDDLLGAGLADKLLNGMAIMAKTPVSGPGVHP